MKYRRFADYDATEYIEDKYGRRLEIGALDALCEDDPDELQQAFAELRSQRLGEANK